MTISLAVLIAGEQHVDHPKTLRSIHRARPDQIKECCWPNDSESARKTIETINADIITVVRSGDTVTSESFDLLRQAIALGADFVYTNEEYTTHEGWRQPWIKPDWSPSRMLTQAYTGRLWATRTEMVASALSGPPVSEWELAIVLRTAARSKSHVHIPIITYLSANEDGSSLFRSTPEGITTATLLFTEYARNLGAEVDIFWDEDSKRHRLKPNIDDHPLVSIVIPSAGKERSDGNNKGALVVNAVRSVLEKSTYKNIEIIITLDSHSPATARSELHALGAGEQVRISDYSKPFNFSAKINTGVSIARGSHLLILNDDTEVDSPDWIESLLAIESMPDVGAAGATLRYPTGALQHAGVMAVDGSVGHPYIGYPGNSEGYHKRLVHSADVIATTGACMLVNRSNFNIVGGFSEEFPINYNDVDFCFKLRSQGLRSVVTPEARLWHDESSTRTPGEVSDQEQELLRSRWGKNLQNDPYYSNLFWPSAEYLTLIGGGEFDPRS